MARCEDFPCCGHDPGCCPDFDESGRQLNMRCICGAAMSLSSSSSLCPSSLCPSCLQDDYESDYEDDYEDDEYEYEDDYDGQLDDLLEWHDFDRDC